MLIKSHEVQFTCHLNVFHKHIYLIRKAHIYSGMKGGKNIKYIECSVFSGKALILNRVAEMLVLYVLLI